MKHLKVKYTVDINKNINSCKECYYGSSSYLEYSMGCYFLCVYPRENNYDPDQNFYANEGKIPDHCPLEEAK